MLKKVGWFLLLCILANFILAPNKNVKYIGAYFGPTNPEEISAYLTENKVNFVNDYIFSQSGPVLGQIF